MSSSPPLSLGDCLTVCVGVDVCVGGGMWVGRGQLKQDAKAQGVLCLAGLSSGLCVPPQRLPPPALHRSQEGLARVVAQAGQRARLADVQDLPAIVHQLLMLSTRGCREAVLTVGGARLAWLHRLADQRDGLHSASARLRAGLPTADACTPGALRRLFGCRLLLAILQEIMRLFDHKEASTEEPNQRRQLLEVQGLGETRAGGGMAGCWAALAVCGKAGLRRCAGQAVTGEAARQHAGHCRGMEWPAQRSCGTWVCSVCVARLSLRRSKLAPPPYPYPCNVPALLHMDMAVKHDAELGVVGAAWPGKSAYKRCGTV